MVAKKVAQWGIAKEFRSAEKWVAPKACAKVAFQAVKRVLWLVCIVQVVLWADWTDEKARPTVFESVSYLAAAMDANSVDMMDLIEVIKKVAQMAAKVAVMIVLS